jgi:hypothetical protein
MRGIKGIFLATNKRIRGDYCLIGVIHLAAVDNRAEVNLACTAKPEKLELKKEAITDIIWSSSSTRLLGRDFGEVQNGRARIRDGRLLGGFAQQREEESLPGHPASGRRYLS